MHQVPLWLRILVIAGFVMAILLPLVVFVISNPMISTQLPVALRLRGQNVVSPRYSVQSEVPSYTINLENTQYLDYMTTKLKVFDDHAIIDPRYYQGYRDISVHYTISHIRFVLVPTIENPISMVTQQDVTGAHISVVGKGDYSVENGTLVVRVMLNTGVLTYNTLIPKFSLEDKFIHTVLDTLYYAHGLSDPLTNAHSLYDIYQNMKDYLYSGIFIWPVQIVAK